MTIFEMGILTHYYARVDDHPHLTCPPPIWAETIKWFLDNGLLQYEQGSQTRVYGLTERGTTYVEALTRVPLPVLKWEVPCGESV